MAKGFGRRLDIYTLQVIVRHRYKEQGEAAFTVRFTDQGWCSWWGMDEPDPDELKWFETDDSAWLALAIGSQDVPGVDDDGF